MPDSNVLLQQPAPGSRQAQYCGDVAEFRLRLDAPAAGQAWLRTNLGRDALRRREILQETRHRRKRQARDWRDIPMLPDGAGGWRLTLPLLEPGHFEAKLPISCSAGGAELLWPPGEMIHQRAPGASGGREFDLQCVCPPVWPPARPGCHRAASGAGASGAGRLHHPSAFGDVPGFDPGVGFHHRAGWVPASCCCCRSTPRRRCMAAWACMVSVRRLIFRS